MTVLADHKTQRKIVITSHNNSVEEANSADGRVKFTSSCGPQRPTRCERTRLLTHAAAARGQVEVIDWKDESV